MGRHCHIDERIGEIEVFRGLPRHALRQIGMLGTPIDRPAGAVLTRQGRRGIELVLLLDGSVRVTRDGAVVAERGTGDFLGEISLLGDGVQTATVTVTRPVEALVVAKPDFWTLLAEVPGLREHLQATRAARLGLAAAPAAIAVGPDPTPAPSLVGAGRAAGPVLRTA